MQFKVVAAHNVQSVGTLWVYTVVYKYCPDISYRIVFVFL